MKYDLASDLHVDHNYKLGSLEWDNIKNPDSNVLVIAGDIANNDVMGEEVISDAAKVYNHVIFVDGNHEHYSNHKNKRTVYGRMNSLRDFASKFENVHYLYDGSFEVKIENVAFIGACSWYDFTIRPANTTYKDAFDVWAQYMNDAHPKTINFGKYPNPIWPEALARDQSDNMAETVKKLQDDPSVEKIVIVTHTVPTEKGLIWQEHNQIWNLLNGSFSNSQMSKVWDADVNKKIVHSVYGHTHNYFDFIDHDGIRFVANPRGYYAVETQLALGWSPLQLDTSDLRGIQVSAFGEIEN